MIEFIETNIALEFKAELGCLSAQTLLMAFGYKAELSGLSAQTKLMAFGYKKNYKVLVFTP